MMRNRGVVLCAVICFSSSYTMQEERKEGVLQRMKNQEGLLQRKLQNQAVHCIKKGGIVNGDRYTVYYANQSVGHCTYLPHERHLKDKYNYREEKPNGRVLEVDGAVARELFLHYQIVHEGMAGV